MGMDVLTDPVPLSQVKLPATTRWGIRHKVVGLVMIMGMLTYLDRVSISKLAPNIMSDLSLSKVQMGYVFSAFALAYALFELPSAWLADRTGTRSMLTRIVIWWSAFTIATAGVFSYGSLLAVRFLFGMGEAGAWPGMAKTFSRWIPRRERGTIQGIFFAGAHLSGGLTPIIVTTLVLFMPWRWIFVVFGALGLVWALVWHHWFRDDPAQHGEVGASELALILSERETGGRHDAGWVYWKKLFRNPNTLGLCLIYFPNSFIFYFCITWLPTFLKEKYGFDNATLGFLSGLPLLFSVFGDLLGGVATDRLTLRFGLRIGRCGLGAAGYLIAAVALVGTALAPNGWMAACLLAVAVCATMFTLGAAWGTCIDVSGDHTAIVSAAMNTAGQVASLTCPLIVAYTLKDFDNNWNITIWLMSLLFFAGVGCWFLINPNKPIFAKESARVPAAPQP
jgi:ACS family glucarate transporter-like MFS transporter